MSARYQQQQQHHQPQHLMQKLHGSSPASHGPHPGGGPPPPSLLHPFPYSGPPQSPAGYPGFGPASHVVPPPPGSAYGPVGPGAHPSPALHHAASGLSTGAGGPSNHNNIPGPGSQQGPGSGSSLPFTSQAQQAHHQYQQGGHQINGHHTPHQGQQNGMNVNSQHSPMNGGNGQQQTPVISFLESKSPYGEQQHKIWNQAHNEPILTQPHTPANPQAHAHARAAHLQQRGMVTSGSGPIADPTRHPSMSIGRHSKDSKEGRDVTANGIHKRVDSDLHPGIRTTNSAPSIRKIAAPGADTNASPTVKDLNTAAIIEAEREKLGQPWTTIDMGGMHLRNLSSELFRYSFLTTLYVPHNNLTSLPSALSTLSHLILLDATGNRLSSVPGELGMLTTLRELLLFDNQLTSLPPELGTLHQLDLIGIEGNPLPDNVRSLMEKEGTSGLIAYLRDSCPVPLPPPDREWITVEADSFPTVADAGMPEPETFSVLSFNVLCEKYATPHMYGYTPSWALSWDYRKELILQEIIGYGADLLCLQEVDGEQYEEFFLHHLSQQGYEGVYFPKSRARTMSADEKRHVDGCAIFYKESTFSLVEQQLVEFNQIAMRRPDFKKTEDMFNRVMRRDDIAVIALLEHKQSGARLIVANVHIYWDPEFRDVKLVQVAMMMDEVSKTADHFARLPPKLNLGKGYDEAPTYTDGRQIPTVICGDFNSVPESGVYQYLANGIAAGSHEDFMNHIYGTYTSEGISHKFSLKSSYSHLDTSVERPTGGLNLTNYVPGFRGVIDYIWYNSASLGVTGLLGEIDQSYLGKVVGLPNAHFPSDHISILAEFKIKPRTQLANTESGRHFRPVHHPHR